MLKTIAQEGSVALVDIGEAGDRFSGVGEGFGRDPLRGEDAERGGNVG